MVKTQFDEFTDLLRTVADYYGRELKPESIGLYWNALEQFDIGTLRELLNQHVKASRFMPTISDLIDALKAMDGRPGSEEAWAIVARSLNDERVTIVWTQEMASAFGVAFALRSDMVAARMAFKESYSRSVNEARRKAEPIAWTPSLGWDASQRETALSEAVRLGRLSALHAAALLPAPQKH